MVYATCFWHSPKGSSLVLEDQVVQVHQKHLTAFEVWKPACPLSGTSMLTLFMQNDVWCNCSHNTNFQTLRRLFPGRRFSHCADITWQLAHLMWQYQSTDYGATSKARWNIWNVYCHYWWLKKKNKFRSVSKGSQKKFYSFFMLLLQCYDILSVTTAGVYWLMG